MATSFSGRSIAITASAALKFLSGGASGIGLAVARGLSLQGASVYIADAAKESPAELQNQRNVYYTGECDITNRGACKRFIDSIPDRLDGLVNCAGICPAEGKQPSDDVFERIMAVNTTGTWNIGTEAIRRMSQQEQRQQPGLIPGTERSLPAGSIVNIGSGASLRGIADMAAYCASKHAVLGLTRSWAKDWPSLRVNMVAPGVTSTAMVQGGQQSQADRERIAELASQLASRIPLGRMAYPTDIADVILFLLSDSSSFITGQVVPVNGGSD